MKRSEKFKGDKFEGRSVGVGEGSGIGYCGKGEEEKGIKMSWGTELWVRNI